MEVPATRSNSCGRMPCQWTNFHCGVRTIHARHSYTGEEIAWGRRFIDIVGPLADGRMGIDYTRFHETRPAPLDPAPAA